MGKLNEGLYRTIPVEDLSVVWERAQRPYKQSQVDKMVADWHGESMGVIQVTQANGAYHVIDGQHRTAAIESLFGPKQRVPCIVTEADEVEAARIWHDINKHRRTANNIDSFLVAVDGKVEPETTVDRVVTSVGLSVSRSTTATTIRAVAALLDVHKAGGEDLLLRTLVILRRLWGENHSTWDAAIIKGMGLFLSRNPGVDESRMVTTIGKKLLPTSTLAQAGASKEFSGGTLPENVSRVLVRIYNGGLRATKMKAK